MPVEATIFSSYQLVHFFADPYLRSKEASDDLKMVTLFSSPSNNSRSLFSTVSTWHHTSEAQASILGTVFLFVRSIWFSITFFVIFG